MTERSRFDADGQLAQGELAPDFELPGVDGKTYRLKDSLGRAKATAVVFWCNHCPYVIKWEQRMLDVARRFVSEGVDFYLIGSNNEITHPQDSFENMKVRARDKRYPIPYLRDESQSVARGYGAKTTPHVFLFDQDLRLRYRGAIDDNVDSPHAVKSPYLENALKAILAGNSSSIDPAATKPVGCSVKWK